MSQITGEHGASIAVVAAVISALAAIASAFISAFISWTVSKRTGTQKIAEFRQLWIDDLRSKLAEFVGEVHRTKNVSFSEDAKSKEPLLQNLNADLMRLESRISLKLNHDEIPSKRLMSAIANARGGAAIMSLTPAGQTSQIRKISERIDDHLSEIDAVSRIVLKWEWNRVKDDLKPISKAERTRRDVTLLAKLADIPNSVEKHVTKGAK